MISRRAVLFGVGAACARVAWAGGAGATGAGVLTASDVHVADYPTVQALQWMGDVISRESGGEFHVVKNTLVRRAFANSGMELPDDYLVKSTAVSFAFTDPALTAKALAEAMKGNEFVKVKGGFMTGQKLTAAQVKALADMPPLPVVRAQLLGVLQAPAGKLVRTIAEPARGLAAVIKAFSEKAPATV